MFYRFTKQSLHINEKLYEVNPDQVQWFLKPGLNMFGLGASGSDPSSTRTSQSSSWTRTAGGICGLLSRWDQNQQEDEPWFCC